MGAVDRGRYPDAFPSTTHWESAKKENRLSRERYLEFWDAGDEYDEQELDPTRPRDKDLLPDV
jgi:hypothetical protein